LGHFVHGLVDMHKISQSLLKNRVPRNTAHQEAKLFLCFLVTGNRKYEETVDLPNSKTLLTEYTIVIRLMVYQIELINP